ncbi:MAG: hypothetical protein NWE98_01735 [Candidatus Bathyarchaeota archaeon]|nr:hypothetical protein [Candidatus Bathyarchaeota archaeon]
MTAIRNITIASHPSRIIKFLGKRHQTHSDQYMCKSTVLAIALTAFCLFGIAGILAAEVNVGVKSGDWIEYNVTVTGNPPPDHDITWARMNVTNVSGTAITVIAENRFANGTLLSGQSTFNLATGVLGDDFFIPKDLNVGDQFYDAYQGNITITSMEERNVAGVQRTIISGSTEYTTYYWDRECGILVSATSHEPDYVMVTETQATNLWQPQTSNPEQSILPYAALVAIVVVIIVIVVFSVRHHRKKA